MYLLEYLLSLCGKRLKLFPFIVLCVEGVCLFPVAEWEGFLVSFFWFDNLVLGFGVLYVFSALLFAP